MEHSEVQVGDVTNRTYYESDAGHVELLKGFEGGASGHAPTSQSVDRDRDITDDLSSPHFTGDIFPDSKHLPPPETPMTDGRKRYRDGKIVKAAATPTLPSNPFAKGGLMPAGMMELSQVFNATQASLPFQADLSSDSPSDRPSPDIYDLRHAAPLLPSSSPAAASRFRRATTDPIITYVTMAESQRLREAALHLQHPTPFKAKSDEYSDDELDPDESERVRRKRRLNKIDHDTTSMLKQVSAPRRRLAGQSPASRMHHQAPRGATIPFGPNQVQPPQPQTTSDDAGFQASVGPALEDDTEAETMIDEASSVVNIGARATRNHAREGDDEAMSSDIQVPMTTLRPIADRTPEVQMIAATQSTPTQSRNGILNHSKAAENLIGVQEGRSLLVTGTQTIAVVDSQPSFPQGPPTNCDVLPAPPSSALPSSSGREWNHAESQATPRAPPQPDDIVEANVEANDSSFIPQPPVTSDEAAIPLSESQVQPPSPVKDQGAFRGPNAANMPARGPESDPERQSYHVRDQRTDDLVSGKAGKVPAKSNGQSSEKPAVTAQTEDTIIPAHGEARVLESSPAGRRRSSSLAMKSNDVASASVASSHEANGTNRLQVNHSADADEFETAHTHVEPMSDKAPSPLKRFNVRTLRPIHQLQESRIRTLTEIAADPSPPDGLKDVDLDFQLINSQDVEFQVAIDGSSPMGPSRKRRRGRGGRALQELDDRSSQALPIPKPAPREKADQARLPLAAKQVDRESHEIVKAKVQSPAKTVKTISRGREKTYASKRRLISSKSKVALPSKPVQLGQSSASVASKRSSRLSIDGQMYQGTRKKQDDRGAEAIAVAPTTTVPDAETAPTTDICAPNRVFALFKGGNSAYYPATCIGALGEQSCFKIRFDDGTIDVLDSHLVRSLDLRVGDVVKVDLPHMRTRNYVVTGFCEQQQKTGRNSPLKQPELGAGAGVEYPLTDIRAFAAVLLSPKQKDGSAEVAEADVVTVSVTSVYIVQSNWIHFKDRVYKHVSSIDVAGSRPQTPPNLSEPTTPSTRGRHSTPLLQGRSVSSVVPTKRTSNIFNNMAFAVSYVGKETEKSNAIKLILEHGGRVLIEGFEELFLFDGTETEENEQAGKKATSGTARPSLKLTPKAERLGFVCLIADRHSRRAKYMQALALGLPCLAGRWIEDCVKAGSVLGWEAYLLPSGESSFLRGAVHSRLLQPYSPIDAQFASTIERRHKLLDRRSVLLIVGKGKAEERRKAYLFLTHALGASRVGKVPSVDAARQALTGAASAGDKWDWVYADGAEADASEMLSSALGKKRKKGSIKPGSFKHVKVVEDEFVVQSLILGRLLEDD